MWIILPLFGSPLMTALTMAGWYAASELIGWPSFHPEKLVALLCAWAVVITVGFWGVIVWEERPWR